MTGPSNRVGQVRAWLYEARESWGLSLTTFDGFDAAIVGLVERFGMGPVVLYDRQKCIEVLLGQGMDHDGAEEYFDFNVAGAWVGEGTPAFVTLVPEEAA
jgi:hypothetical protein